jgi:hypothetical protein
VGGAEGEGARQAELIAAGRDRLSLVILDGEHGGTMSTPQTPEPGSPGAADTAKKLADQTIDLLGDAAQLAKDIPTDTAKLLLRTLKDAVSKLEDVVK